MIVILASRARHLRSISSLRLGRELLRQGSRCRVSDRRSILAALAVDALRRLLMSPKPVAASGETSRGEQAREATVERVGDLQALLHLALATHADRETTEIATPLITSRASSTNREQRAEPLPGPGQRPVLATSNSAP
jgi:hypothetical protein